MFNTPICYRVSIISELPLDNRIFDISDRLLVSFASVSDYNCSLLSSADRVVVKSNPIDFVPLRVEKLALFLCNFLLCFSVLHASFTACLKYNTYVKHNAYILQCQLCKRTMSCA